MLFEMLCLPAWSRYPLGVRFLSEKYAHHQNPCPRLPEHMAVEVSAPANAASIAPVSSSERCVLPGARAQCTFIPHWALQVGSAAGLWQSYARMESGDTDEEDEEDQGYINSGVDSEMERSASGASASTACHGACRRPRLLFWRDRKTTRAHKADVFSRIICAGDVCAACDGHLGRQRRVVICPCTARAHAHCLAVRFLRAEDAHPSQLIPTAGQCPVCNVHTTWAELVAHTARVNRRPLREVRHPAHCTSAAFYLAIDAAELFRAFWVVTVQLTTNRGTSNAGRSRVGKRAAGHSHDDPRSSRGRHGEPTAVAPSVLHGLNEQAEAVSATPPPPPAPHATSWERRGAATVERERGRIARWATAVLDSPDNSPLPVAATLLQLPSSQESPALVVAQAGADCCSVSSSHVDDSYGEENETETGVVATSARPPRRDMSPRMARLETTGFTPRRRPPSLALVGSLHARARDMSPDTDDADDTAPLVQRLARRRRDASTPPTIVVIVDSSSTD